MKVLAQTFPAMASSSSPAFVTLLQVVKTTSSHADTPYVGLAHHFISGRGERRHVQTQVQTYLSYSTRKLLLIFT